MMEVDSHDRFYSGRSVEEVQKVIAHAKLVENDLQPLTQVIGYAPQLLGEDVKLVQVSKQLADRLQEGETVVLRGEEEEGVVLCTGTQTFDLKEAETSNSLLILPEISFPGVSCVGDRQLETRTVQGQFCKYYELTEIKPRTQKLQDLLLGKPLTEDSARNGSFSDGMTLMYLKNTIQASEAELRTALVQLEAVEFRGHWFVLDPDYKMKILSFIIRFFDENSWALSSVHKKETVATLKDLVDEEILAQVFDLYCEKGGEEDHYSLRSSQVCRIYGDYLLAPGSSFSLPEFLSMWQKAVPEGLETSLDQLAGLVLVDTASTPHTIKRFTESELPHNIHDRLSLLFHAKARWTLEEISPFVEPLTTPKLNVNALLTKYARPVNSAGGKFFCAKHGK